MWRKSYLGEDIGGMSATIVTDFPTDIPTEDELPLLPKQKHKYETLLPWRCTFIVGYTLMHMWEHLESLGSVVILAEEGPRHHVDVCQN
jgi:hypothetical protein